MNKIYRNYVAGEWIEAEDVAPNLNPSDLSDTIGDYARGSIADVNNAVAAAKAALPRWSRSLPYRRYEILKGISDEIFARKDELGDLLSREEGKILSDGIAEVIRAAQTFAFFAGEAVRLAGELVPSIRPGVSIEVTREPVGIVGLITPWNFPAAIPSWKIAPALAFGNCVVFKPAELAPGTGHALTEIISRSGIPSGVFNLVMGAGSVVGQRMLEHPDIHAVSFTGSVETGRRIAAACVAGNPMKKFQLEMGGKNPLIVLDDADLNVAVDVAVNGAYFQTGQRCTASSRLIVTPGIYGDFVDAIIHRLESLVVDDARKQGTQMGPVVDESQFEQDLKYIEIGRAEGAKLAFGGSRLNRDREGYYLQPALFVDASNTMRIAREEIFGPVTSVIRARNYDEALAFANETTFGLSSGICTKSLRHATHFKRNSEAGMVMVNLPTAGMDFHVPFGGTKGSSYGAREQGSYAKEFYTTVKTAYQQA